MRCAIVFFIFLAFTSIAGALNYAFLFTSGFPKRKLGVKFTLGSSLSCDESGLIEINKITGKLTLLKNLPTIAKDIKCTVNGNSNIFIRVLPSFAGDTFADHIIPNLDTIVLKKLISNKIITRSKARKLFRKLRALPKGDPMKSRSLGALKVEKCLELTKDELKKEFISDKNFGSGTVVIALFRVKKLFSTPVLQKLRNVLRKHQPTENKCVKSRFRTFNGECNNLKNPMFGAADTPFIRILPAKYFDADGLNDPIGFPDQPDAPVVPSPFEISRDFINVEVASTPSQKNSHAFMQFGQFLDHDLDLTDDSEGAELFCEERDVCNLAPQLAFKDPCYPILPISDGQPLCINFIRSAAEFKGHDYPSTREQTNIITSFIDGSQIYGSSKETADSLRELTNDRGRLRVSSGNLLPLDPEELGDGTCIGGCFQAGDIRSNEQQSLNSIHTLFLREHNRVATILESLNSNWNGERIYQETRKIVGAVLQKITFNDYLPRIIGRGALPPYKGFKTNVNPGVSNAFATAAYRFGHSAIRTEFDLLNSNFDPADAESPSINLRFMFFNNTIINDIGIEPILLGLVGNASSIIDRNLASGIIDSLFERPGSPGLNLAALNIQRSRDHGLPGYNEFRKLCGLSDAKTFADTKGEIQNAENRRILSQLYNDDPNLAELWVAGLAETPFPGASVGPTFRCVIANQFQRSRDGDRFFFTKKGVFKRNQLKQIRKTSLSRIFCDNLNNIVSIQRNAFSNNGRRRDCKAIPGINLCLWKACSNSQTPQINKITGVCSCVGIQADTPQYTENVLDTLSASQEHDYGTEDDVPYFDGEHLTYNILPEDKSEDLGYP